MYSYIKLDSITIATDLLKRLESCRLDAYQDVKGVWTIGYGHTDGVKEGDSCSQEQADSWLEEDIGHTADGVDNALSIKLSAHQGAALISFVYNIGVNAFRVSTARAMINNGRFNQVPAQMQRWVYAGTKLSEGLVNRREAESQCWNTADT